MKKAILVLFALTAMVLSSCLTIYEKYTINRDGSGSFEYLIDMSELYSMMETFASDEDLMGIEDSEMSFSFSEIIPQLNQMEGISNATELGNAEKYIFGIKFDFRDEKSLNTAMAVVLENNSGSDQKYVEIQKKRFTRFNLTSNDFSKEALLSEEGVTDESMVTGILEGMKYRIEVNMPRKIKTTQTKSEVVEEDTHRMIIEANFNELLDDPDYLKTVIRTK